jgi:N-acetylglucosamine-6-phosphate deacetylase
VTIESVGRLVLEDRVVVGRVTMDGSMISAVALDEDAPDDAALPYLAPGFVDLHVHGGGGHDAMGDRAALDGMARHLLRHGVTGFLPTAVAAPIEELAGFAARVRDWVSDAPADAAEPLGFNLEGPFLAEARRGAHDPAFLRVPADLAFDELVALLDGLRIITIAPELPGALELIAWLAERGVVTSLGHSDASSTEAQAGYDAGATSTTHLFNAMSGLDHRLPGVAAAALLADQSSVELIADGVHVDAALWPLVMRLKPRDRVILVSDGTSIAGTSARQAWLGGLQVEVSGDRATLAGTTTLAGSVITLDRAVRNLVMAGVPLPTAAAAASANPLALLGITDRGRIAVGKRADLVELGDDLTVQRVMRAGAWLAEAPDQLP